jgi:hypothetical protein
MEASTESILSNVRSSAIDFVGKVAPDVAELDQVAIEKFAAAIQSESIFKAEFPGVSLPLRFPDQESEINFYAILHCLDFGSVRCPSHV